MDDNLINLYSDTQTKPTPGMREAIAAAPVGDEQRGEDPSVNRLCEMGAAWLGKERAVFLPSGTMCNEIAVLVHCRPGDEIIADRTAHVFGFEAGGPAAFAGAMVLGLDGRNGLYTAEQLRAGIRVPNRYSPNPRLVVVEQTANMGGGTVWPVEQVAEVAEVARERGCLVHMDGARLPNAVVASGVPAAEYARHVDTVWFDLSKGLGCPVGGVLAGSDAFIEEVWRWKQRIGGAMRQAGIVAAAGVYALEHHVERLAEDHANARRFAEAAAQCPGVAVDLDAVQTNMAFMDVSGTGRSAVDLAADLERRGVRIGALDPVWMRACTHLDVTEVEVDRAIEVFAEVVG